MRPLLTPADVAELLGVRDPRTVRRRLAELGCLVVPFGRSYRIRAEDLDDALAAAARVEGSLPAGEVLAPRLRRMAPARSVPVAVGWWRQGLDVGLGDGHD